MRKLFLLTLGLLFAPIVQAETATTSTGDVDVYAEDPGVACAAVMTSWTITLTLIDPSVGDSVQVAAEGGTTDVATSLRPSVFVFVPQDGDACRPLTTVGGLLVDGELAYTISWQTGVPI